MMHNPQLLNREKTMNNCLLLIDIQNDYFPGGNMELVGMNKAAKNAQLLLKQFRSRNLPVIHVQHFSVRPEATFFLPDTTGVEINEHVAPIDQEIIVHKNYPNSFRDTELLDLLNNRGINTVTICGAMSHMCIDATTRAAFDYSFSCVVAADACATRDLVFDGCTVDAEKVHASFMAALSMPYAEVLSTKELLDRTV